MSLINAIAALVTLTALFSYINHRWIRLPTTIGVMLIGLLFSLGLIGADTAGFHLGGFAEEMLTRLDFDTALLHGMLSFLLFAGALHVDLDDLRQQKFIIASLATIGIVLSTLICALLLSLVTSFAGLDLPFIFCLLFGALISPTDPIAVLAILKGAGAPDSLKTKITGESLFNDGIGVVVFLVIAGIAYGERDPTAASVLLLLVEEVAGGIVFGLAAGYLAYRMLKDVDSYQVEILITLALVSGGYALASALHVSGPIAVVVAGLMIGNHGRMFAMSERTREHLDTFWELLDELLNAVLFVLIGLEILVLPFRGETVAIGAVCIVIVLAARAAAVGLPVVLLRLRRSFSPHVVKILTWGGLRGGISVALALSLPPGPERDVLVTFTYCVVVFSILVQGLTIGRLVRWSTRGLTQG